MGAHFPWSQPVVISEIIARSAQVREKLCAVTIQFRHERTAPLQTFSEFKCVGKRRGSVFDSTSAAAISEMGRRQNEFGACPSRPAAVEFTPPDRAVCRQWCG